MLLLVIQTFGSAPWATVTVGFDFCPRQTERDREHEPESEHALETVLEGVTRAANRLKIFGVSFAAPLTVLDVIQSQVTFLAAKNTSVFISSENRNSGLFGRTSHLSESTAKARPCQGKSSRQLFR